MRTGGLQSATCSGSRIPVSRYVAANTLPEMKIGTPTPTICSCEPARGAVRGTPSRASLVLKKKAATRFVVRRNLPAQWTHSGCKLPQKRCPSSLALADNQSPLATTQCDVEPTDNQRGGLHSQQIGALHLVIARCARSLTRCQEVFGEGRLRSRVAALVASQRPLCRPNSRDEGSILSSKLSLRRIHL